MELLGIENLRHTADALGLLARKGGGGGVGGGDGEGGGGGGRPTLREIAAAGRELCGGRGDAHKGRQKPLGPVEAARHCFGAAYTVALLQGAFGIGPDERGVEFSGSVVPSSSSSSSSSSPSSSSATASLSDIETPERVTPEWTAAAAALVAADAVAAWGTVGRKGTKRGRPSSPLPFEALLRAPGEATAERFSFRHRRRLPLARFFLACGALSAAAAAARSLSERRGEGGASQQKQRSSGAGGGDGGGSPLFPSSADAASDALADGSSPLRGGGSKLSKR